MKLTSHLCLQINTFMLRTISNYSFLKGQKVNSIILFIDFILFIYFILFYGQCVMCTNDVKVGDHQEVVNKELNLSYEIQPHNPIPPTLNSLISYFAICTSTGFNFRLL